MKVTNNSPRKIGVATAGGIVTIAPGKSASFDEDPTNLEALKAKASVKVAETKKEEPAKEPQKTAPAPAAKPVVPGQK